MQKVGGKIITLPKENTQSSEEMGATVTHAF
jgi:hypothetical protein